MSEAAGSSTNPAAEAQQPGLSAAVDMSTEKQQLSPDDAGGSKKGRGLLQVPSRSSSQKNQSSPASTGLSGATVSDSRNSIDGRSKDSKGSFLGRHRNGSASSHSNQTGGTADRTPANSQPTSPTSSQRKKRGGLLSLLGCCGVPDSANTVEGENENAHKVDRLPTRPATARSRTQPAEQAAPKQLDEKEPHQEFTAAEAQDTSSGTQDQITAANGRNSQSKQSVPPAVTVDAPKALVAETEGREAGPSTDEDVVMKNASVEEGQETVIASAPEEPQLRSIPPPPPGPGPAVAAPSYVPEATSSVAAQKWLLPPITQDLKGRKCLVLDLDETLVHSSFKVSLSDSQVQCSC